MTPSFAEYFRDLVETVLDEVAVPDTVDADIDRFRDVMIADGTVLRLHEFLAGEYEARKEKQAGAKLHLLHNATRTQSGALGTYRAPLSRCLCPL
ncbi:transposase (ISH8) [Natronobacterium gregoryi SP2]|uniref:Transposase (ISH8) n=1 Tax=Natronobacterium gregoryi (strain ATCC 43098 / DSM 3393 / CCM 3738 / CIP 104747 / IAM 13177 / JCM 8860 / NBRC 102187 / NCIMB 2189 / SP2) TaxID=797304 RepID=L9XTK6_NATGS|nr:transposase (ISH8) [Natronobacterium gregoryi SP2]